MDVFCGDGWTLACVPTLRGTDLPSPRRLDEGGGRGGRGDRALGGALGRPLAPTPPTPMSCKATASSYRQSPAWTNFQ